MMNKILLEKSIGRKLNEDENKTVEWVNGWEKQTALNLQGLVLAAKENGFAEGVRAAAAADLGETKTVNLKLPDTYWSLLEIIMRDRECSLEEAILFCIDDQMTRYPLIL